MSSTERATPRLVIRALDPGAQEEVELVALRMRETLQEVLGAREGEALYSMEWLRARVRFHLDAAQSTASVFLAEDERGLVIGHTIVRIDSDDESRPIGLFSTTYVAPESRRAGTAKLLLHHGEQWMREHGMTIAVTDTSDTNTKLIRLFETHGYAIVIRASSMVRLAKTLR